MYVIYVTMYIIYVCNLCMWFMCVTYVCNLCMYAGVCMYACMHVCMYACMHVCMYACMHVCMYVCTRDHIYIYTYINKRVYIYIWDGNSTVPKNIKGFGYISSRCHFFCLAHAPSVCTKTSAARKWQIWSAKWCFNFLHNDMDTRSMRSWLALPEHICFSRKLMEVAVSQSGPLNRQDELPHHPHSRSLCP